MTTDQKKKKSLLDGIVVGPKPKKFIVMLPKVRKMSYPSHLGRTVLHVSENNMA